MKFCKIRDVKSPERSHNTDAGIDFFIPNDFETTQIFPHSSINIPSGIKAKVPHGYALIAFNKSGVATKLGLDVGASVVDEGYQGEIHLHLTNTTDYYAKIEKGQKIVQFILLPVNYEMPEEVNEDELFDSESARGEGGFGSTGVN